MSSEIPSQKTQVCPTCGTRLSESATRCLVCGTELGITSQAKPQKEKSAERSVQASRMPEITLSLPIALGLMSIILLAGAAAVFFGLRATNRVVEPTAIPTATETLTPTATATEIFTNTPIPTPTEIPPFDYTVQSGELCSSLAFTFGISVQSIIITNNLPSSCPIYEGQVLKIPYPTATPAPLPTSTLSGVEATEDACEKVPYTVQSNDTLSSISLNYGVSMEAIKQYNGLSTDNVFLGQSILIPLCMRATPVGQATATPTTPPPYPAPNLLLPADGGAFTLANDVVTLQWSSVGTLRDNEVYQVTIEDVTDSQARRITDYVTDTKYIVPTAFRPKDNVAHVLRWWVTTVRQAGTDSQGQPIYDSAGSTSDKRVFTWVGSAVQSTPEP
jgi:LysM repeat protein